LPGAGHRPADLIQRAPPVTLVDNLPPDKPGKEQEYQWPDEIVEYYFDIFVQSHSQTISIKNSLTLAKTI
jgi:hypothetical protein